MDTHRGSISIFAAPNFPQISMKSRKILFLNLKCPVIHKGFGIAEAKLPGHSDLTRKCEDHTR